MSNRRTAIARRAPALSALSALSALWALWALAALLQLTACVSAGGTSATVPWGCDAPAGRTCYFSIQFAAGGVRNFNLAAGRRIAVGGVRPGKDRYLVTIDAPTSGDSNQCRRLVALGRTCQRKIIDFTYND